MDALTQQLIGQGVLGVVCVILLLALRELFKRLMDSQEKRIAEAVENRAAVERNTSALNVITEVVKARVGQ